MPAKPSQQRQTSWLDPDEPANSPRDDGNYRRGELPPGQLLKWVGSKHRFAAAIVQRFPSDIRHYWEPFVGSASVLAALAPRHATASDALLPLVQFWQTVQSDPQQVQAWYADRWREVMGELGGEPVSQAQKTAAYLQIRQRYNDGPNPADLLFLLRSCYGGVVRFSKTGKMNTPCGIHRPIEPREFAKRLGLWRPRTLGTRFENADFETMIDAAGPGDLVYCDPPYSDSESTLYGAQSFTLARLMAAIERAKSRGVRVALSIDGSKRTRSHQIDLDIPAGLFGTTAEVVVGRSMLRRFQLQGQTLESEVVHDRLLLTWRED